MIWKILIREYRYRLGMVSTWVYMVLIAGVAFLVANIEGGAFDGASMGGRSGEFSISNSPMNIASYSSILFFMFLIAYAAIFGSSAVRHFDNNSYELYFTKPIKPSTYLLGKFLGAYLCVATIALAMIAAMALGFMMPYLPEYKIGQHQLGSYMRAYAYLILPNLLLVGAVCFNVGLLTRKVINSYIAGLGLFFSYLLASLYLRDVEKLKLAAMLDPLGVSSLGVISRYWTTAQRNVNHITLNGILGWNRLLWVSLGLGIMVFTILRFGFRKYQNEGAKEKAKPRKDTPQKLLDYGLGDKVLKLPYKSWQQFRHLVWYELKCVIFNRTFMIVMAFFSFFLIIVSLENVGKVYGTQTHPITIQVLEALIMNYELFGLIIITFYSGELIWRDKTLRVDQLYDVTPHYSKVRYFSKLGAIILMQIILLFIIMLVGMIMQLAKGHLFLEPGLYFSYLFGFKLLDMIPLTLMAFFWSMVMNNRYSGYLATIGFYLIPVGLNIMRWNHPLVLFGYGDVYYSDMNGYGVNWQRFFVWLLYWLLFAGTLSLIGFKLWNRGTDTGVMTKLRRIRATGWDAGWRFASLSFIGFLALGGLIFYNTNIINEYTSPRKLQQEQVEYEKLYRARIMAMPQPRVSAVDLSIDMYPSKRSMDVSGSYWLVNQSSVAIDTLVLTYDEDYAEQSLKFTRDVKLVETYAPASLYIYSMSPALAPQDSIMMEFAFEEKPRGFPAFMGSSSVRENGTFFHNVIFPRLGYQEGYEISDNNDRKKKGLPPKLRMAAISDSSEYGNTYVSTDSDYVRYSVQLSTEEGQLAFAPGELLESKTENGRYMASYGSKVPILNFLAFLSGEYEVAKANYGDIQVEIYYDKKHAYNIGSMLESGVNSLKYFSESFMPYPYKTLRIVEIPYENSAQSFPAMIPFSENIGFVAKIDPEDESAVDYPYQVVSHEIGHQWWAHTVIGANVQGATMLSEVFTEYSSLMVVKQKYGKERLRRYLSYTHDNYLRGRGGEDKEELPLYLNENQGYIHYEKGPLVMFALQDEIGEHAVNDALGAFCRDYAYRGNPFPLSTDVLPYFRNAMPEDKLFMIEDLFETITLYENKLLEATQSYDEQKKIYITKVKLSTAKFRADGLGNEKSIPLSESLDIALYDDEETKELAKARVYVTSGEESVYLVSKEKPGKVILDPFFKKIDKDRTNNIITPS